MVEWQLQSRDYYKILAEQNPWRSSGIVPSALAPHTERSLAQILWQRLLHNEPRRHQMILGPRRVGKTTVLYQTVRHLIANGINPERIWWLRMDHPVLLRVSLGDLVRTILDTSNATREHPVLLMIDEIVYAHDWDLWLKTFHDEHWPIQIAATSSGTVTLREQRRESGVGRWEEHHIMTCRLEEVCDLLMQDHQEITAKSTLAETLASLPSGHVAGQRFELMRLFLVLVGGFPELVTRVLATPADRLRRELEVHVLESQRTLRGDAVERAVYKDIPQSAGINNPMLLERLLYVLAGQVTGIVSPINIGRQLGIKQPTLDRYLSYLEQAYLVFTLTNYSASESSVQRRGRKLYFIDSAVRNAALHRGFAPHDDPIEQGMLLENLVATTLNTLAAHAGMRLHHWRDGNNEVDLIYNDPRQPLAFEIASSVNHSLHGLEVFTERYSRFSGYSYLIAPQATVIHPHNDSRGIGMLPLDTFLLAVGAQAHQAMITRLGVST